MSRTKSKYLAEKIAEKIPPSEKRSLEDIPAPDAVTGDEATVRLKQALDSLKHSEALQSLAAFASHQAAHQGHQIGSPGHQQATREIFDQTLARMQEHASNAAESEPSVPRPPPPPPAPERAAIYSAPVSREVANGSGRREPSPGSVRLSFEQRQAAAAAGISEVEYARQLQKLPAYKKLRGVEHE
jgi:hypothetical protein